MISHEHRAVFVHIPKTAGTSIEAALGHQLDREDLGGTQDHRTVRELQWRGGGMARFASMDNGREAAHGLVSRWRRDGYAPHREQVSARQFRDYFTFSVVRNPWDRAHSWYRNVLWDEEHRARLGVPADIGFTDFLRRCAGLDLLRPQTHWLLDYQGRIGVDAVCRFENLAADFESVCDRIGLDRRELPHLIRGGSGHYHEAYDDQGRRIVAARFADEIARFGYAFESVHPSR